MADRKTRALRLCPCPPYDVEGMESWLSDLAARGLLLEEDGSVREIRRAETLDDYFARLDFEA